MGTEQGLKRDWVTLEEAAKETGVPLNTLYDWRQKAFKSPLLAALMVKQGKRIFFSLRRWQLALDKAADEQAAKAVDYLSTRGKPGWVSAAFIYFLLLAAALGALAATR
ncbi:MAG: hypothetical protein ACEB74_08705 [Desulfovibrio aminophilus]|uniref:hypothetical protein n=1 Tax=Desulfovibrio aminophilus TaxID=81425 RepID=UPI0039EBD467